MISHTDMLNKIYQSVAMGRSGIADVLKLTEDEELRSALMQQLREYDKLAASTKNMLHERGEQEQEPGTIPKLSAQLMSNMQTMADRSPSRIAELMIKGNNMGVIECIRDLHDYPDGDERILDLAHKLLQTEQANIEQMKKFL